MKSKDSDVTGDFGIYVHIPYCYSKCSYCDFNSFAMGGSGAKGLNAPANLRLTIPEFVEGLCSEIRSGARLTESVITSIYFGGGTPTILAPSQLIEILSTITAHYTVSPDAEITVEANPESLAVCKHEPLMAAGFNRISIGLQSTDRKVLKTLGRPHGPSEAMSAVAQARLASWPQISVDLIYGVPGQSLDSWRRSMSDAVSLGPDHISLYGLSVHDGTAMARRVAKKYGSIEEWEASCEDDQAEMYEEAVKYLSASGFGRYETSNFARPGSECRHSLLYWNAGGYLGFGPGANSHLAAPAAASGLSKRWENFKDIYRYVETTDGLGRQTAGSVLVSWTEELPIDKQMSEAVFLALRLESGLDLCAFEDRFGHAFIDVFPQQYRSLTDSGLLVLEGGRIRLAGQAHLIANQVMSEFV